MGRSSKQRGFALAPALARWSRVAAAILCLCLPADRAAAAAAAAAPGPWRGLSAPVFDRIVQDATLPNSALLTAMATDGEGFLWIGTQNGLSRWDGHTFRTYVGETGVPGQLPGSQIQVLHTDQAGRLWVGTVSSGLARYDPRADRFVAASRGRRGIAHGGIKALADDGRGGLWVGADAGLDHLDAQGEPIGPGTVAIAGGAQVLARQAGRLWIGTKQGLLQRFHDGRLSPTGFPAPGAAITALTATSDGRLWVGTERDGAFVREPNRTGWRAVAGTRPLRQSAAGRIDAIEQVSADEVWMGTFAEGLLRVDARRLRAARLRPRADLATSLPDHNIRLIHRTPAGLVFVGTARALSRFDPQQKAISTLYTAAGPQAGLAEENIVSAFTGRDGRVWLGGVIEGLEVFSPTGDRRRLTTQGPGAKMPRAGVRAIVGLPDGDMLVGGDEGLLRVSRDATQVRPVRIPGRERNRRVQALAAHGARIWVGGLDGLWQVSLGSSGVARVERILKTPALSDMRINALLYDRRGHVWIGAQDGLNRLDPQSGRVERFRAQPGTRSALPAGFVSALLDDRQGRVWVGTFGGGLAVIEDPVRHPGLMRRIGVRDGLPNTNVNSILEDSSGAIWVSTDKGLARLDAAGRHATALQGPAGVKIQTYWLGAGTATQDGQLLFGGAGGMTRVDPSLFKASAYRAPLRVTGVRFDGKPAEAGGLNAGLPLKPPVGVRNIAIDFSALDYLAPERVRFAYRLKGVDPDWVTTDATRRTAAYTNLAPRAYELEVRASYPDGGWRDDVLRLPIEVSPRWYETLWFRALILGGVVGLLLAAGRLWTGRLRRRKIELEHLVAERTEALQMRTQELEAKAVELKEARARAEALAAAKADFLATMSHEIRTPMNGILGLNGLMLRSRLDPTQRTFAEAVQLSAKNLMVIINDILDASKLEAGKMVLETAPFSLESLGEDAVELLAPRAFEKGLELTCAIAPSARVWVEGDAVRLRQVVLNLLSNAVKFTDCGEVVLSISGRPDPGGALAVRLEVADTGIGLDEAAKGRLFQKFEQADQSIHRRFGGTGLGLSISRDLVTQMGGAIGVCDNPGGGSLFWIELALPTALAPQAHDPRLAGVRILAMDPSAAVLEALGMQLAFEGASLEAAPDLAACRRAIAAAGRAGEPFHAILVDAAGLDAAGPSLRDSLADAGMNPLVLLLAPLGRLLQEPDHGAFDGVVPKPLRRGALVDALVGAADIASDAERAVETQRLDQAAQVLLAEDNAVNRQLVGALVEAMGCVLTSVEDGRAALEASRERRFDLILMDVNMPLMGGLEATRRIRRRDGPCRATPILALTASAADTDRAECLAAGMNDFISKPIDIDQFARTLARWLTADDAASELDLAAESTAAALPH